MLVILPVVLNHAINVMNLEYRLLELSNLLFVKRDQVLLSDRNIRDALDGFCSLWSPLLKFLVMSLYAIQYTIQAFFKTHDLITLS